MASTEEIAGSVATHELLSNIVTADGKFRNPSKWRATEMGALRISFANLENAVPADRTLDAEIDTSVLAKIFKERDERGPAA